MHRKKPRRSGPDHGRSPPQVQIKVVGNIPGMKPSLFGKPATCLFLQVTTGADGPPAGLKRCRPASVIASHVTVIMSSPARTLRRSEVASRLRTRDIQLSIP